MTDVVDLARAASDASVATALPDTVVPLKKRRPWESVASVLIDLTTASLAVAIGMTWSNHMHYQLPPSWMVCFFAPTVVTLFAMRSLYRRSINRTFLDELPTIEAAAALAAMLLLSGLALNEEVNGSLGKTVARVWMCGALLIPAGRLLWIAAKRHLFRRNLMSAPTLIVGNGRIAEKVVERINSRREYGLRPIGLVDDNPPSMGPDRDRPASIPYLGKLATIEEAIALTRAECMVVAFSRTRDEAMIEAIRIAHKCGMDVWVVPRIYDTIGVHARIDHIGGLPLIAISHTDPRGWQFAAKHASDRMVATVGLILISPLFLDLDAAGAAEFSGPDFLQPAPGRARRTSVQLPEVPIDATPTRVGCRVHPERRRGPWRGRGGGPAHSDREIHASHLAGRTSATDQRRHG